MLEAGRRAGSRFLGRIMINKPRLSARTVIIAVFLVLIGINFFAVPVLRTVEFRLQDMLVRMHALKQHADPDVVVVNVEIGRASCRERV